MREICYTDLFTGTGTSGTSMASDGYPVFWYVIRGYTWRHPEKKGKVTKKPGT